jgi:uncharacterized protein YndB with AHSA1/START domain
MVRIVRKVLIGLAVAVVLLVVVVSTRPSHFKVERTTTIAASPDVVFAQLDDFHAWAAWSPWEKLDPQMKRIFDGRPSGVGAIYAWEGNDKVGEGRMTITDADLPRREVIQLEFLKPFQATNVTTFTLVPGEGGTKVTWAMEGDNGFTAKAATLFMDMDSLVGGDFERGLAGLKTVSEAAAKAKGDGAKAAK